MGYGRSWRGWRGARVVRVALCAFLSCSCGGKAVESESSEGAPAADDPTMPPSGSGGAEPDVPPPSGGRPAVDEPPPVDGCEADEGTGLLWEPLSDEPDSPSYWGATYTWYDLDESRNGGDPGVEDGGVCAFAPCDTRGHENWINGLRLCGFGDWRLPRVEELLSLAESDGRELTGEEPFYWSAETFDEPSAAWGAYLCCGGVAAPSIKAGAGFIRLVRSE